MIEIIIRRILILPPLLIGMTLIVFVVSNLLPGDPVAAHLGQKAMENPEIVAAFRAKWGLDKPLHVQYLTYLRNLLRGDLGVSIKTHKPVREDLARVFPASAELGLTAIFFAVVISFPLGIVSALKRNHPIDHGVRVISLIGLAAPAFWLAFLGLYLFYLRLRIFPGFGRLDIGVPEPAPVTGFFTIDSLLQGDIHTFRSAVSHLILPALVLAASSIGLMTRMIRSSLLNVLGEDYIRTARGKGLAEQAVLFRHALRNALIPTVTVLGMLMGYTLVGAVLVETVFGWPGMGRYGYLAVTSLDFPATMGVSLVVGVLFVLANLAVDIAYIFLDPRLRAAK